MNMTGMSRMSHFCCLSVSGCIMSSVETTCEAM